MQNYALLAAAAFSLITSVLHVAIIFGGANWYRFFGAGEQMAQLSESGSTIPTLVTTLIAIALLVCAGYALSGAGVIATLPFSTIILLMITAVFLLRGLVGLVLPFVSSHPAIAEQSITFWLVSSAICTVIGLCFLLGTLDAMSTLRR